MFYVFFMNIFSKFFEFIIYIVMFYYYFSERVINVFVVFWRIIIDD